MSQAGENLIHHDSSSSAADSKKNANRNPRQILDQQSPEEEQKLEVSNENDQRRQQQSPSQSLKEFDKVSVSKDETLNMTPIQKIKHYMEKVLDNPITQITMGIITVYALFGDDVRTLVTNSSGDPVFWYLNCVCLGAFSLEIIVTSICKKGYFNSFFFYLDIISTVSLILDIGWISNQIFSQGTAKASNAASLAKAGRASRVGTKAGRVVRIVRLIRLVKLYKLAQQRLQAEAERLQQLENDQNQAQNEEQQHFELANKTVLQKKVNQLIIKNQFANTLKKSASGKQEHIEEMKEAAEKLSRKDSSKPAQEANQLPISDEIKIIKISKLPPLTATPHQGEHLHDVDGHLISETNDMVPEKKDAKKMAEEVITMNRRSDTRKKSKAATTIQRMKEEREREREKKNAKNPDITESKVGQKLSDLTTQRVIIIVLCIMISIPLFDTGTYSESSTSYDVGLSLIYRNFPSNVALTQASMKQYLDFHNNERNPILSIQLNQITNACCKNYPNAIFNDKRDNVDDLRNEDKYYYTSNYDGELQGYAVSDLRDDNKINAILSIVRTIFVSVVLSTAAILFSSDVETLVLNPIESMMKKVRRIAENPLEAAQIEEREALALDQLAADGKIKELQKIKEQEGYETVVLEKLIIKIGALLALGFGEAGSEIIASNMSKGGDVDPMLPGKKIVGIFGFCDIRNFTDATEVLQTGVMLFVNEIAEIAHSTVDAFLGQSNKNIGDAFLLVWKYPENEYGPNAQGVLELKDTKKVHNFADLPVIAFLKIMASLTISKKLMKYRNHKGLNERLKNYRVKMGFGLHVGWAIEGAIGSSFKIDASYLSPNVNMASRLEAATKQFGTGLLVSGHLFNILSKKCQSHLRHIDRVTVKGSIEPLDMYTVDVHLDNIVDKKVGKDRFDNAHLSLSIKKKHRVIERLKRNKLKDAINAGKETPADWFEKDKELVAMREFFTKEFYEEWEKGFDHYIGGRWPQAKAIFDKTLVMLKDKGIIDGPSNTLLEVIQESGGKAPSDWKGYRALTEK